MKFFWLRIVVGVLAIIGVMAVERVIGLPVLSLTLLMILLESISFTEKMVVAAVMGIVLALFYLLPLALGVAMVGVLVAVLERRSAQARQRFGYILLAEIAILSGIGIWTHVQLGWQFWMTHAVLGMVALVVARYSLRAK